MSNKRIRLKMIQKYGNEDMMDKLGLSELNYKSSRLEYHHIKEKHEGGQATIYNGALLSGVNHKWLHEQSTEKKQQINQEIQRYKLNMALFQGDRVLQHEILWLNTPIDEYIKIPLKENEREENENERI